jgi:hypothetical protein
MAQVGSRRRNDGTYVLFLSWETTARYFLHLFIQYKVYWKKQKEALEYRIVRAILSSGEVHSSRVLINNTLRYTLNR